MSCMNLWIWSMLAIGKFHRVKAGKAINSWIQGWKVEGFAWLFLKDRSSRSKPTGCRSVCFFCGFPVDCINHWMPFFVPFCLEFVANPGICQSQTSRQRQWWWPGEMDGSSGEDGVNHHFTSGVFNPGHKKGGLFHGLGNPTPPKRITGRIQGFVKWEAVNFSCEKFGGTFYHEFPGLIPSFERKWKEASLRLFFHHCFLHKFVWGMFLDQFWRILAPRILKQFPNAFPFATISNISVDWFFWGLRHATRAKKTIPCETSRNGWCQALYKRSFRRET